MRKKFRIKKDRWTDLRDILAEDQEFNSDRDSLRGRKIEHSFEISNGRLDFDLRNVDGIDYVIYSYATPIAWRRHGEWRLNTQKYSVTTSVHQAKVETAVAHVMVANGITAA